MLKYYVFLKESDRFQTVCGHVKHHKDDKIDVQHLRQAAPCNELKSLHALIKDKFFKTVKVAFLPIETNPEFYFCRYFNCNKFENKINSSSNDDISNPPSEKDISVYSDILNRMESVTSDVITGDINPLFLNLVCTMRYNNGDVSNTTLKVLPTCLGKSARISSFFLFFLINCQYLIFQFTIKRGADRKPVSGDSTVYREKKVTNHFGYFVSNPPCRGTKRNKRIFITRPANHIVLFRWIPTKYSQYNFRCQFFRRVGF